MSLSDVDYAARARTAGLNVLYVAEQDTEYNCRLVKVNPANPTCNCYSIAKAFTVMAIGMAYDRGLLRPEDRVVDFFEPSSLPDGMDKKWRQVTLDNLMLHSVGFGRGLLDIDADDASTYPTHDYLSIVLSEPLPFKPGVGSQYTDAAYYLLSRVISRVSGQRLVDFLRPTLMKAMSFKELAWSCCPEGYSMGATGLYLRTEDIVKLGVLYLNGGVWRGERLISREWVDKVLLRGYEFKPKGGGWFGKGGMRGQMLAFHPDKQLAVAWNAYDKIPFDVIMQI